MRVLYGSILGLMLALLPEVVLGQNPALGDPGLRRHAAEILTSNLEVQLVGGEFTRWGTEAHLTMPKVETFRYSTRSSRGGLGAWKVLDGPPGSGTVVGTGSAGRAPAPGRVSAFHIDFARVLGSSAAGTYWVTLEIVDRGGRVLSHSTPVRVHFVAPGDPTTFTERGLAEPIAPLLENARQTYDLPALGAAIVTAEGIEALGAVGIRQHGRTTEVTEDDLWHIGSNTKAMTATLAAILVDRGVTVPTAPGTPRLNWDTTLGEVFPLAFVDFGLAAAFDVDPWYADVTLLDLIHHQTGQRGTYDGPDDVRFLTSENLTNKDRRRVYVFHRLSQRPVLPVTFSYSNHNYILAAAMLEEVTGRSWEEMMRTELFEPLGMVSAGFGSPGVVTLGEPDQPRGHSGYGATRRASFVDNPPATGPAGNVHVSLRDYAKFIRLHLNGSEGDLQLTSASLDVLHNPVDGYAGGWGSNGTRLWHDGSNNLWYTRARVYLDQGYGVITVTNVGDDPDAGVTNAMDAMTAVQGRLSSYHTN